MYPLELNHGFYLETVNDLINLVSHILGYHVLTLWRVFNRRKAFFGNFLT